MFLYCPIVNKLVFLTGEILVFYKKFTFSIEIFFVLVYNIRYIGFLCPCILIEKRKVYEWIKFLTF